MKDPAYFKQTANCQAHCTSKRGRPCRRHVTHGIKCWYHSRISPGLNVTKSHIPNAGLGLYARKTIHAGQDIAEFQGPTRTKAQVNEMPLVEQAMCIPKHRTGKFIDVAGTRSCYARYANEAPKEKNVNAKIVEENVGRNQRKSKVCLEATKDLHSRQEVETDYGAGYPRDYKHFRKEIDDYHPGTVHSGKNKGASKALIERNRKIMQKLGPGVTSRKHHRL